ncbi:MAG: hypothetical protein ABI664_10340 [bacterium]
MKHLALMGQIAAVVALLVATTQEAPWNTTRATLVAGTTATASRIVLVRGIAIRDDVALRDGTIEVDLDAPRLPQFAGLAFRVASAADYEIVYFSGNNGTWHDVQYHRCSRVSRRGSCIRAPAIALTSRARTRRRISRCT